MTFAPKPNLLEQSTKEEHHPSIEIAKPKRKFPETTQKRNQHWSKAPISFKRIVLEVPQLTSETPPKMQKDNRVPRIWVPTSTTMDPSTKRTRKKGMKKWEKTLHILKFM
jgi:hypothetical protein